MSRTAAFGFQNEARGKKRTQRSNELMKQVLVMVSKISPYKINRKSTALLVTRHLLRIMFV